MVPDANALLSLEPEELAGVLLAHLNSLGPGTEALNHHNFFHQPRDRFAGYPPAYQQHISEAFIEAWAWLERENFLVPRAYGNRWYSISRRGARMQKPSDVDAYRMGNLLPRGQLHPAIAQRVWATFLRGDYDTAVFQAFKQVEVSAREAGAFDQRDLGTDLMRKAFAASTGPLSDKSRLNRRAAGHVRPVCRGNRPLQESPKPSKRGAHRPARSC